MKYLTVIAMDKTISTILSSKQASDKYYKYINYFWTQIKGFYGCLDDLKA